MEESKSKSKIRIIRAYFSGIEKRDKKKEILRNLSSQLAEKGMQYTQMRLPVSKITPKIEEDLKSKIEAHILNAKIRLAGEEDFEIILDLYNKAWMTSREPYSRLTFESLKYIYNYPDTKIFIAKLYGIDVAFMILDLEGTEKEFGVISALAVLPRFQSKGIGKVMGLFAWSYFNQLSVKELRCEVHEKNLVSFNFIKSLGFQEFDKKIYKIKDFQTIEA